MKAGGTPVLDPRDASLVLRELLARRPAYVPELIPTEDHPSWALLQIFSRYMETVIDRLNQAPDKNLLAFLDMLGISLIPARAARAPVVFLPLPTGVDGRIPAGTRVGAEVLGRNEPVMFETERAIAMAAAHLVEVVTLWPVRDEYANHTTEFAGGRAFTLFEPRRAVPHEIYVAHDTVLAFAGAATVEVEFELSTPGSAPFEIAWAHWDGQAWRPFEPFNPTDGSASEDGTAGLTRSGVVKLCAECGESRETKVNGIEAHWVRGRLEQPLPPDPARVLPEVDRIRIRSVIRKEVWTKQIKVLESSATPSVSGVVRSHEGTPLSDVTVGLFVAGFGEGDTRVTNEEGRYQFEVVQSNVIWDVNVSRFDLPFFRGSVPVEDSSVGMDFIFNPGVRPDLAISNGLSLDISKSFYPFGYQPQPGSAFYISSEEVFSKRGAVVTVHCRPAATSQGEVANVTDLPYLSCEYWDGKQWRSLQLSTDVLNGFFKFGAPFRFHVPADIDFVEVNGQKRLWLRIRVVDGTWIHKREVSFRGPNPNPPPDEETLTFPIVEIIPPVLSDFRLGYTYRPHWQQPTYVFMYNDFQFALHSSDARVPGRFFSPFRPVSDTTPALYLGFDRPLPNDLVSLFMDIEESSAPTPPLVWEAWDGFVWQALQVDDGTAGLQHPGIVSFIAPDVAPRPEVTLTEASGSQLKLVSALEAAVFEPGDLLFIRSNGASELAIVREVQDNIIFLEIPLSETYISATVALAALPRFGRARDWVRARLKQGGTPAEIRMNGVHLNAAAAVQLQTIQNELLGSGTGQPGQAFFLTQIPVLPGEQIEVRELEGPRAEVELPILQERLLEQGLTEEDIRTVSDPRSGGIVEVWVHWTPRPHLFFSSPEDRHYVIERSRGRVIFGNGRNGRLPTIGINNIQVRRYRAGGGLLGNVPVGAITQVLEAVPFAQGVINPRAADGGAEAESPAAVKPRGPRTLHHRGRGLAARDYETLAHEASAGVAAVRVLPAMAPNGRPAPGWITVIIVPQSQESRPQPSFELRKQVHLFLAARAPATMPPERIGVIGPTYLPIGVAATITPRHAGEAGTVEQRVRTALLLFLHPLTGGPEGRGWPFGRDVYLSDVAAVVEAVDGVDYAQELNLLLNDTPRGERVEVPPDRMVVAGTIRIEMKATEERGG